MAKTTLLNFKSETTEHTFELKDGEPVIDGGAIAWDEVLDDWIMWNFKTPIPAFALPFHMQLRELADAYDWEGHFRRCIYKCERIRRWSSYEGRDHETHDDESAA